MGKVATGTGRHKVILLGEHAVVHGYPAVGAPLDAGVRVTLAAAKGSPPGISVKGVRDPGKVGEALRRIALAAGVGDRAIEAGIETALEPGAGLGGSAALCVAFARAILAMAGEQETRERTLELAAAGEAVFHGNPSGMDAWLAASDGPVLFSRRSRPEDVPLACDLHLAVLVTGSRAATSEMVAGVARRLEAEPAATRETFREIARLALAGATAMRDGRIDDLGRAMSLNHEMLGVLGVITPPLDAARDLAIEGGALGAKMTGAGGGGAVVALYEGEDRARAVVSAAAGRLQSAFVAAIRAASARGTAP